MPTDADDARRQAIRLLARRDHSRRELGRKLRSRGADADAADEALDELEREGLLSDRRFVESYIHQRVERGYGPARILAELRERGVEADTAADALKQAQVDWAAQAQAARRKRFGPEPPADRREWTQQARFLNYRGFESDLVRRVLDAGEDE